MSFSTFKVLGFATLAAALSGAAACSSSDATTASTPTASTAAAVAGEPDTHCGATVTTVDPAVCKASVDHTHDDAGDAGAGDAGDAGADDGTGSEYGPARFNAESDDDDCKYHLRWKATPIAVNRDVSFVVTVTNKSDGAAVKGATPRLELFLNETHPGPNVAGTKAVESPDGTYTIGPVRFDEAGQWTVRFHFFETCNDSEHSPHGHAAFFATVP